ncbi:MAG TPA: cellulase family glycosylhydrolase [Candidatus Baltobacteraceae bacterium]|nr:cellulase family glycosylhydrolase [Candidatus Baltobacteraceae bacterium]
MSPKKLSCHAAARASAALVLLLAPGPAARASANDMLHASTSNGTVVTASGAPVELRCVNLSPWLDPEPYLIGKALRGLTRSPSELKQKLAGLVGPEEAQRFWQQWQAAFITEADFARLERQGFNCVRLPLNYKYLASIAADGSVALDEAALAPVDHAVAWGAAHHIYVILDLHAAPGGQNPTSTVADVPSTDAVARLWQGADAATNQKITIALWHALAARYASARSVGGYDLLNEPLLPSSVSKDALPNLYDAITTAIRSVDRNHMVILEGDRYARDFDSFPLPTDSNVMYEFHEYSLLNPGWRQPGIKALAPFLQLRASTGVPLWLGEFGEETLEWQRQMVQLMEANHIGWAVWPWKRIDLGNNHPAVETIALPDAWESLFKYLVGAWFSGKPSPENARQAMAQMLEAIRTENCTENPALVKALTGR